MNKNIPEITIKKNKWTKIPTQNTNLTRTITRLQNQVNEQAAIIANLTAHIEAALFCIEPNLALMPNQRQALNNLREVLKSVTPDKVEAK